MACSSSRWREGFGEFWWMWKWLVLHHGGEKGRLVPCSDSGDRHFELRQGVKGHGTWPSEWQVASVWKIPRIQWCPGWAEDCMGLDHGGEVSDCGKQRDVEDGATWWVVNSYEPGQSHTKKRPKKRNMSGTRWLNPIKRPKNQVAGIQHAIVFPRQMSVAKLGRSVIGSVIFIRKVRVEKRRIRVFQPLPSSLAAFRSAIHSTGNGFPGGTGFGIHLPADECSVISWWPGTVSVVSNGRVQRIRCGMPGRRNRDVSGWDVSRNGGSRWRSLFPVRFGVIRVQVQTRWRRAGRAIWSGIRWRKTCRGPVASRRAKPVDMFDHGNWPGPFWRTSRHRFLRRCNGTWGRGTGSLFGTWGRMGIIMRMTKILYHVDVLARWSLYWSEVPLGVDPDVR